MEKEKEKKKTHDSKRVSISPDIHHSKRQSGGFSNLNELWSAQCGECFKWRLIPSQEEFEEIRSKFTEDPFVCSKIEGISCDDHAEIEVDNTRTWVIHKPGVPNTPAGFKRSIILRKNFSKTDCYYITPNGKRLRAMPEVLKFLESHPEYSKHLSVNDFSFAGAKVLEDTLPLNAAKKV